MADYLKQMRRLAQLEGMNATTDWASLQPEHAKAYVESARAWIGGVKKMDEWADHIHSAVRMAEDTTRLPDRRLPNLCGSLGQECPAIWKKSLAIHTLMVNGAHSLTKVGFNLPSVEKLGARGTTIKVADTRRSVMARGLASLERKLHTDLDKLVKRVHGYSVNVQRMVSQGHRKSDREALESQADSVVSGASKVFDHAENIMERVERLGRMK